MDEGNELTAYCGLYCGDCIRYKSNASDLTNKLLVELDQRQFSEYANIKCSSEKQMDSVADFKYFDECCKVLKAIAALQCNTPCRTGGGCASFSCVILKCKQKKGFKGCWQCRIFEDCKKLDTLKSIHGKSHQQNLKAIKEFGLTRWTEHRHKSYVWQE